MSDHYDIDEVLHFLGDNGFFHEAKVIKQFRDGIFTEYITFEELDERLDYDVANEVFNNVNEFRYP